MRPEGINFAACTREGRSLQLTDSKQGKNAISPMYACLKRMIRSIDVIYALISCGILRDLIKGKLCTYSRSFCNNLVALMVSIYDQIRHKAISCVPFYKINACVQLKQRTFSWANLPVNWNSSRYVTVLKR